MNKQKVIQQDGYTIRIPLLNIFEPKTPMEIEPIELSPSTKKFIADWENQIKETKEYMYNTLGIPPDKLGNPIRKEISS